MGVPVARMPFGLKAIRVVRSAGVLRCKSSECVQVWGAELFAVDNPPGIRLVEGGHVVEKLFGL